MRWREHVHILVSPLVFIVATLSVLTTSLAYAQRPPTSALNLSYLEIDFIRPGARAAAMGGASIGAAQEETAGLINPAGLTYVKRPTVSAQMRVITFTDRWGGNFEFSDPFTVGVILPIKKFRFGFARHQLILDDTDFITEQFLTIGSNPSTRQVLGGVGNFPGKEVDQILVTFKDNWTIAYEISKRLSIGLTAQHFIILMNLRDRTFLDPEVASGSAPRGNSAETVYSITTAEWEEAFRWAGSIGLTANVILDKLFFGAVANRGARFGLGSLIFLPEYKVDSQTFDAEFQFRPFDFKIPDRYGLGLYYRANNRLNLTFDIFRIEYSDLLSGNDLNIVADDEFNEQTKTYEDPDGQPDLTVADATEFHVGVEWLIKVQKLGLLLPLRFGVYTDPAHRIHAVSDDPDLQTLFPKADDRVHFAFGTGLVFSYGKIDIAFDFSENYNQLFLSWTLILP